MCFSSSTLFYGLTVRALPLCLVARAYTGIKPTLPAVDLIRARRDAGTLETRPGEGDADVRNVPGELWDVIKEHVVEQCYADEVDAYVRDCDNPKCGCPRCCRRPTRTTFARNKRPHYNPLRFNLDDLRDCVGRRDVFIERGGMAGVVQACGIIRSVLRDFGLCVPDNVLLSTTEFTMSDVDASFAVAFPHISHQGIIDDTTSTDEIPHQLGPAEALARVPASAFVLPPDATRRFRRLLVTFPMLEPTTCARDSTWSSSEPLGDAPTVVARKESEEVKKVRLAEESRRAKEPRWILWGQ